MTPNRRRDAAVAIAPRAAAPWAKGVADVCRTVAGNADLAEVLRDADCVLLDAALPDVLDTARRALRVDPTLQTVLVAAPAERALLERALLFTRGLGEVWIVAPAEVDAALVERAADVARRRRAYRATRAHIAQDLAALAPHDSRRAAITDAYLAALLEAVPDPVISIDSRTRVLSWNPAAEHVLGYTRPEAIGRTLAEVLGAPARAALGRLLAESAPEPARDEVRFRRSSGELGIAEIAVVSVEDADQGVRAVLLHDVTEERSARAELEALAGELEEHAAELEMANDELQRRTTELEDALSTRARFYAAMNHELRTPVNAVIGFNELLLDGIFGPLSEPQAAGLERAQRAAYHLLELVNDVLDLAKIEAGRIEIESAPTHFPDLLEELLGTVAAMAAQSGTELILDDNGGARREIVTDARRVRQVLLNLLSNAIKFGDGRPVHLRWTETPAGGVAVEVVDQGRGIAPEDLTRIFEEFEQVGSDARSGTGLGLAISQRLAALLGGVLHATSQPGSGSTFRLVLPAVPGVPAE